MLVPGCMAPTSLAAAGWLTLTRRTVSTGLCRLTVRAVLWRSHRTAAGHVTSVRPAVPLVPTGRLIPLTADYRQLSILHCPTQPAVPPVLPVPSLLCPAVRSYVSRYPVLLLPQDPHVPSTVSPASRVPVPRAADLANLGLLLTAAATSCLTL